MNRLTVIGIAFVVVMTLQIPASFAAPVYVDPFLADCIARGDAPAYECTGETGVKVDAFGADDEYIDLATNIVYRRDATGLTPIGFGLPSLGYVEMTTCNRGEYHAATGGWTEDECDSSSAIPCTVTVQDCPDPCSVSACTILRIHITECHNVKVEAFFVGGAFDNPFRFSYSCGEKDPLGPVHRMISLKDEPRDGGGSLNPLFLSPLKATSVTTIDEAWSQSYPTWSCGPTTVVKYVATLQIDDQLVGKTEVPICGP